MKSGFVVLVGRSNVGKSTLLNTLVGTKIAAVTHKPQTTRHAIQGALNTPEGQIVFVDTPGIFKTAGGALAKALTKTVEDSIKDIDVLIYVVDPTRSIGAEERALLSMARRLSIPKLLVINKSDLPEKEKKYLEDYRGLSDDFDQTFELSALRARHVKPLINATAELLPKGEPFYDEHQKTNLSDTFWVSELIREKVFLGTGQEIPYSVSVEVDSIEEKKDKLVIKARILTTEEKYKKMLIGSGGRKIKEFGMSSRKELEAATNKSVYLDLQVEVDPHWVSRIGS